MHFALGRERLVPGVMVNLAVDGDGHLFELFGETQESARRARRISSSNARRVDDDVIDAAGVFRPATWKVDRRHSLNLASRVLA